MKYPEMYYKIDMDFGYFFFCVERGPSDINKTSSKLIESLEKRYTILRGMYKKHPAG